MIVHNKAPEIRSFNSFLSVVMTIVTIFIIAIVIMAFYPARDITQYARLQEKLISDVNGLSNHTIQIYQVMSSTIQEFPDVTHYMIDNGNSDDFYHLFNDIIVYNFLNGNSDSKKNILNDIQGNLNRFMYTQDITAINVWNMTH